MNKPNITRQRKPMPVGQSRGPIHIQPQDKFKPNLDPTRPRKNKKHKRR